MLRLAWPGRHVLGVEACTVHTVDKGTHPPGRLRLIGPRWCVDESLPMAAHPADHMHSRPGATRYDRRGATHLESIAGLRTVIWYLPTSSGVCQGAMGSTLLYAHGRWSSEAGCWGSAGCCAAQATLSHARRPHDGGEGTGVER